ncbi:MAG: hypothetical protein AAGF74_16445 [Pseudomonadota bacterium]
MTLAKLEKDVLLWALGRAEAVGHAVASEVGSDLETAAGFVSMIDTEIRP